MTRPMLWFGEIHGTAESPRFVGDVMERAAAVERVQLGVELPADRASWWSIDDGRGSVAMQALVERAERCGAEVVPFGVGRDREMADAVAAARDPRAVWIGLAGNWHTRRAPDALVGMLAARGFALWTFDVAACGGTFWACVEPGAVGVHVNRDDDQGPAWTFGPARDAQHDGVYRVGATTASPPVLTAARTR